MGNVLHYQRLDGRVFAGVGVAAVHHDGLAQIGFLQCLLTQGNVHRIVVGLTTATAQYYVTVVVALGADDGAFTLLVDTQEAVRMGDRLHGVNSNIQAAVGAVLEADSHRQATAHFPVGLGFRGTGSDGRPGDGVLQVLRRNRIQRLGCRWQAQFIDIQQQATADVQALFDVEGIVQVRIVDQAFPANGSPRLFKVNPHHQQQGIADFVGQFLQSVGIVPGSVHVVDRAGANYNEQTVVFAVHDVVDCLTAVGHGFCSGI